VESVRTQSFQDWQLIAVDDGSTDDSAAVLEHFSDSRIRLIRHARNLGVSEARNTGIQGASGDWIAFLDSDDEWLPEKLAAQLNALREVEGGALCVCGHYLHRNERVVRMPNRVEPTLEETLHRECPFGFGSTLLIRRSVALELGGMDPSLTRHEDWDWVLRAVVAGHRIIQVDAPMVRVYNDGDPRVEAFAPSTEAFLLKHAPVFLKKGVRYQSRVVAAHYESVASMAYRQRFYLLGNRYLLKSYCAWPWRSPIPLAALPLSLLDFLFGSQLIQRGADFFRRWLRTETTEIL
jgi:glycosyltransferase involved in cell wall biosynthesis